MVCDYWRCEHVADCRNVFSEYKFPPCATCPRFDKCDVCANYIDCAKLITRYLPDMFRRLVREIRNGEDTAKTEQLIRRNTKGKKY